MLGGGALEAPPLRGTVKGLFDPFTCGGIFRTMSNFAAFEYVLAVTYI